MCIKWRLWQLYKWSNSNMLRVCLIARMWFHRVASYISWMSGSRLCGCNTLKKKVFGWLHGRCSNPASADAITLWRCLVARMNGCKEYLTETDMWILRYAVASTGPGPRDTQLEPFHQCKMPAYLCLRWTLLPQWSQANKHTSFTDLQIYGWVDAGRLASSQPNTPLAATQNWLHAFHNLIQTKVYALEIHWGNSAEKRVVTHKAIDFTNCMHYNLLVHKNTWGVK